MTSSFHPLTASQKHRKFMIPKLDTFVSADYKSLDMRVLSHYLASIGDETLMHLFANNHDPHTAMANRIFGNNHNQDNREAAKTINYAILYGGGPSLISKSLHISTSDAEEIMRTAVYPGLELLKTKLAASMSNRGYIVSIGGHKMTPPDTHRALPWLIQGSSSDIMRTALANLHKFLIQSQLASHVVFTMHDEILIDVLQNEQSIVCKNTKRFMLDHGLPCLTSMDVTLSVCVPTWADKTKILEVEYHEQSS